MLLRLAPLRASGGAHNTGLKEVEAGATVRAHTQQNPPGCHEGVGSNGPIGLPPYEVLRLGSPANTGGAERGARWPVKPKGNERKRKRATLENVAQSWEEGKC